MIFLKALGKNPSFPLSSFWWLSKIPGILWLRDTSLQWLPSSSHGIFPSVCLYLHPHFPLLIRTPVIGSVPTLIQYDFILTWPHLQIYCFQIRTYSPVPGGHKFGGSTIQPSTLPLPIWGRKFCSA